MAGSREQTIAYELSESRLTRIEQLQKAIVATKTPAHQALRVFLDEAGGGLKSPTSARRSPAPKQLELLDEQEFNPLRPHDPHCIFCKIVEGQIPSARVLETADAVAFLDINPVIHGHTLVVPKAHHAHLSELPDSVAAHIGSLLPRLCRAIRAATGSEGLNVIVNNGQAAGQTIDHCHWHIIPRFHDDPVDWPWPHSEYVGDELGQMEFRIVRELNLQPAHS